MHREAHHRTRRSAGTLFIHADIKEAPEVDMAGDIYSPGIPRKIGRPRAARHSVLQHV